MFLQKICCWACTLSTDVDVYTEMMPCTKSALIKKTKQTKNSLWDLVAFCGAVATPSTPPSVPSTKEEVAANRGKGKALSRASIRFVCTELLYNVCKTSIWIT